MTLSTYGNTARRQIESEMARILLPVSAWHMYDIILQRQRENGVDFQQCAAVKVID